MIREATDADVSGIREVFVNVYGDDYPYRGFLEDSWLKHSIYNDDVMVLVAEDDDSGKILGTASVVFDVGAHSDLLGEFGRLAVHPEARGQGLGRKLMKARCDYVRPRIHVGLVENRCVHPYSQKISIAHGFQPVGFLPMKHAFKHRESVSLYASHFGDSLRLRKNHPRVIPEAHALAQQVLRRFELPADAVADESSVAYPAGTGFEVEDLTAERLPALLRIERGRVTRREVFGPVRLHYGFFKLSARQATYLVARQPDGGIAGAVGFIRDDFERAVKVFELIFRDEATVRPLMAGLLERCEQWGIDYVECDVSGHAPRMQRTLLELGFLPAAYVPAMVFEHVERLDVVRMVRLLVPLDLGAIDLTPEAQAVASTVLPAFARQEVLPEIAEAVHSVRLFDGLTEEQSARLASVCTVSRWSEGELLFAEQWEPKAMYLILDGDILVSAGGRAVGDVGPGEALGEVSLLTGERHSASATAKTSVTAAVLSKDTLRSLTRSRPDVAVVLYRNLARGLGRKLRRARPVTGSGTH